MPKRVSCEPIADAMGYGLTPASQADAGTFIDDEDRVTTGPVQVVTPSGTLSGNVNFQVLP